LNNYVTAVMSVNDDLRVSQGVHLGVAQNVLPQGFIIQGQAIIIAIN
jgi:hypothetical protein